MTDIFFSYSSKDRERVRPVRDALVAQGFDVFWDQAVPAGVDWDTWIRSALQRSKCALVFWSENSIASDNVRHEATVAKTQGKLVPVLIEELRADQFPMGLYSVQGAKLTDWTQGTPSAEWDKLQAEVEAKLTPLWVSAKLHNAEAAIEAEKARRLAAESRIRALQGQLAKAAEAQGVAEQMRDAAQEEVEGLQVLAEAAERWKSVAERERSELQALKVDGEAAKAAAKAEAARLNGQLASLDKQLRTVSGKIFLGTHHEGREAAPKESPAMSRGWAGRASGLRNSFRGLATALVAVACVAWFAASQRQMGPFREGGNEEDRIIFLSAAAGMIAVWMVYAGPWFGRFPTWLKVGSGLIVVLLLGFNLFFSVGFGVFGML